MLAGLKDSKFSVLFSNAPSTLQNIPPNLTRGRGESEPSRERREQSSSSRERTPRSDIGRDGEREREKRSK